MSRPTLSSLLASFVVLAGVVAAQGGPRQPAKITFTEHVARIIFNQCTTCRRPTAIGPFSLTNYKETRRKGKMIKRVTSMRFMPPWHPVPGHGEFQDSRRMSEADVETIAAWVDSGMAEGDPKKLPAIPKYVDGGGSAGRARSRPDDEGRLRSSCRRSRRLPQLRIAARARRGQVGIRRRGDPR